MLQLRARHCLTRPWRSIRSASQLSQRPVDAAKSSTAAVKSKATVSTTAGGAHKPSSILSRSSDRTKLGVRRNPGTEQKISDARAEAAVVEHRKPRPRGISFVSAHSAQKRDDAAEKWFTEVRQLDIDSVDQPHDLKAQPHKRRMQSASPRQHEMRPGTDLNALFRHPTVRFTTSLRLQTKRELGGDYASYLPKGYADPRRLPVDYARLVLGRNKDIPLNAQTGALNIIGEAIRGRTDKLVA